MKTYHIVSVFDIDNFEISDYDEYFDNQKEAFEFQDILNAMGVYSVYSIVTKYYA